MLGLLVLSAIGLFVFGILVFLYITLLCGHSKCESYECLSGKTAVVTGGSSGIGYQIVLSLASRGCRVIIIDRVVNENIKNAIIEETDNTNIRLEYADLASFKSVREVARRLNRTEEKLDILINNAGVGASDAKLTEDGLNSTMQINYYSHFLLTHLLVNLLKKSKKGRIVFTSSILSFVHVLYPSLSTPEDLETLSSKIGGLTYANSKFAVLVVSDIFAEKLKQWNITCNTFHPSFVNTPIFSNAKKNLTNIVDCIMYFSISIWVPLFSVHPKVACQPALLLSVSKKFENISGIFYGNIFPNARPRCSNNKKLCKNLWEITENLVKLEPEERL